MMEASEFDSEDDLSVISGDDGPMYTVDDDEINIGGDIPDTEEKLRLESAQETLIHTTRQRARVGGAAVAGGVTGAVLAVPLVAVSVTAMAITAPIVGVTAAGGAAYMAATSSSSSGGTDANSSKTPGTGTSDVVAKPEAERESDNVRDDQLQFEDAGFVSEETLQAKSRLRWMPGVFQRTRKPIESKDDTACKKQQDLDASEHTDASSSELNDQCDDGDDDDAETVTTVATVEQNEDEGKQQPAASNTGLRMGGMMWIMAANRKQPEPDQTVAAEQEESQQVEERQESEEEQRQEAEADKDFAADVPSGTPEQRGIFRWMAQRRRANADDEEDDVAAQSTTTPTKSALEQFHDDDDRTVESPTASETSSSDNSPKANRAASNTSWFPSLLARRMAARNGRIAREVDTDSGDDFDDAASDSGSDCSSYSGSSSGSGSGSYSGSSGSSDGSCSCSGEDDDQEYLSDDDDESEEEVVFGCDDSSIAMQDSPRMRLFSGEDLVEGTLAESTPPLIV